MRVSYLISLVAFFCLNGCIIQSNAPIAYDYSFNGKFEKFRTYNLFTDLSRKNNDINHQLIITSLKRRMQMLGYSYDSINPDVIVSYHVYHKELEWHTFSQPSISAWTKGEEPQIGYQEKIKNFKNGTLLIQMIDGKTYSVIWRGYVNNNYERSVFEDDNKLNAALTRILDQYRFFAYGFLEEKIYLVGD